MKKVIKNGKYLLILFIISLTAISCDNSTELDIPKYKLVWQDEFNGPAGVKPDSTKWKYDVGTDWGNAQLEYDSDREKNASLDGNGNLVITAYRENIGGQPFSSARIKTQGLFSQKYGRFEAKIKLPYGPGIWPAFWLLGDNIDEVGWPQCGEIDIMESRGQRPNLIAGTVHGPGYSAGNSISQTFGFENARFDTGFHIFAVEWGVDFIRFYVDDNLYKEITPGDLTGKWVFDHPFFIILNVAVGGNYVGFPTSETVFPQKMIVDYVRVYQEM